MGLLELSALSSSSSATDTMRTSSGFVPWFKLQGSLFRGFHSAAQVADIANDIDYCAARGCKPDCWDDRRWYPTPAAAHVRAWRSEFVLCLTLQPALQPLGTLASWFRV